MTSPSRIEGYAIVSADGMLANAAGIMPDALKFDADQRFFEHGLDSVDVVAHGRHSHEQQTQSHLRRRLILTRQIAAVEKDPNNVKALLWNPAGATFAQAWAALGVPNGSLAVIGGTEVFGMFLPLYDVFYLTRAPKVRLPGGRPVFPGVPAETPEQVMSRHGLAAEAPRMLDAAHDIVVVSWRRSTPRAA
jgi:dihydrofolate reductase